MIVIHNNGHDDDGGGGDPDCLHCKISKLIAVEAPAASVTLDELAGHLVNVLADVIGSGDDPAWRERTIAKAYLHLLKQVPEAAEAFAAQEATRQ